MVKKLLISAILLVSIFSIASAEVVEGGFNHEGCQRSYILHIPSAYNEEDSLALVITLHGGGKNAHWIEAASRMHEKGEKEGFFVCYPNGTQTGGPGQNNWNAGPPFGMIVDDVSFISVLIRHPGGKVQGGYLEGLRYRSFGGFDDDQSPCLRAFR